MKMDANSPVEAYREAGRRYLRTQDIEDWQEKDKRMRELKETWEDCFSRLIALAETRDSEIWMALGDAYSKGWGIDKNREKAAQWFKRAADEGHVGAMVRLGMILQHPETPESHGQAIEWYRRAAGEGDPSGMVHLGFAYREGRGVAEDSAEAVRWFLRAVDAGNSHALVLAGRASSNRASNRCACSSEPRQLVRLKATLC
ncbi:MAG: sel1 repeat family protein [Chthoniobacterales bacterium]|nr:sel1 repeat family protein [Chthoniobacterales bacterium]